jgi:hypothetical protein
MRNHIPGYRAIILLVRTEPMGLVAIQGMSYEKDGFGRFVFVPCFNLADPTTYWGLKKKLMF